MDSSQNMSYQAGQANGQAQQKGNRMMDKASNAAQSAKESLQEVHGAHNRLITSPPVAVFPHPLASDLSFSRYWNYLRKHTFVLESMVSPSPFLSGPKIGARINRPSGGSSKTKLAKLQPARTVSTAANMKLDGQKPMSPLPSQKPSNASTKVSSVSGGLKKCLSISPQAHNETDNDVPNSGLDAEKPGSPGMLDSEINLEKQGNFNKKDIEIAPIKGDTHGNAENIKPSKGGEDAICSVKHLKTYHLDFHAPELSCSKEFFVLSQKEGSPSDILGPTSISPCPVTSEITASTRTPFAVKNSFCNSEGDFSTGLSIGAVEKISSLSSLKSAQTENS
ncbi:hypothetical protein TEA_016852 [Camellia sinensis var. sinensis]|uniref:Uncharacterized protein n=1 Tax=Camellia sinensis var. sinensis TaxID=542762 RepID=A0A4S4CZH4_CAMSN|nr:hypothetical protein TEA_016852 [Camellia sinensis var. sinensis]